MWNLVSTPDFDGLPSLQELTIIGGTKLVQIHPSLGTHQSLKYIFVKRCSNLKKFPAIDHIIKLENLCIIHKYRKLELPKIKSDVKNLVRLFLCGFRMQAFLSSVAVHCPNLIPLVAKEYHSGSFRLLTHSLRKLDLYRSGSNHFSKLDFNLSKLTMLVHLDLSFCDSIEKLPEFPSSLVIFRADYCDRLTDIGDANRNCKWLCQVSVIKGGVLSDGNKLLQSMLQGKAIENHSMVLLLKGLQIPRMFPPQLVFFMMGLNVHCSFLRTGAMTFVDF